MGNEHPPGTSQPEAAGALPPSLSLPGVPCSDWLLLTRVCCVLPLPSDKFLKAELKVSLESCRAQETLFSAPHILPEPKGEGRPQPGPSLAPHTLPRNEPLHGQLWSQEDRSPNPATTSQCPHLCWYSPYPLTPLPNTPGVLECRLNERSRKFLL